MLLVRLPLAAARRAVGDLRAESQGCADVGRLLSSAGPAGHRRAAGAPAPRRGSRSRPLPKRSASSTDASPCRKASKRVSARSSRHAADPDHDDPPPAPRVRLACRGGRAGRRSVFRPTMRFQRRSAAATPRRCSAITLPDAAGRRRRSPNGAARFWSSTSGRHGARRAARRCPNSFAPRPISAPGACNSSASPIDAPDKVRQFADEIGLNYPSLIGGYGAMELSKTLGNRLMALPFTVVDRSAGRIAHTQLGPLRDAQLRSIVGQLL